MTITITLPHEIETRLQDKARSQQRTIEELAIEIISDALAEEPALPAPQTPEEVVARIREMPPDPRRIRPAKGSLAEALRNAPEDPLFDLELWQQEWRRVEAEIRELSRSKVRPEENS